MDIRFAMALASGILALPEINLGSGVVGMGAAPAWQGNRFVTLILA
jgi:hypothetical protein